MRGKTTQGNTRQYKTIQNTRRHDDIRQGKAKTRQCDIIPDKINQAKARQGKTRQGKPR